VGVEAVADADGAVHAPAVAEGARQAGDGDVPVVAGAVAPGVEADLGDGVVVLLGQQHQPGGGAVAAEQGEVDGVGELGGAQRQGPAAGDAQLGHASASGRGSGVSIASAAAAGNGAEPSPRRRVQSSYAVGDHQPFSGDSAMQVLGVFVA